MPASPTQVSSPARTWRSIGRYRWVICALLFFATTINYIDRQVIGAARAHAEREFGWTELDYGHIVFTFQLAYAIGLLVAGRVMDRLGTQAGLRAGDRVLERRRDGARRCAPLQRAGDSVDRPSASTGFAFVTLTGTVAGFSLARFVLGLGEAGNFPAAIKAVAEWFPKKERALATGIFNSGTNVGALLTPLAVPWITLTWGWEWAFIATGCTRVLLARRMAGDVSAATSEHPRVSTAELAYIRSDPPEAITPGRVGQAVAASPDLGLRDRQVHDRSDLVAVSVLDARFPAAANHGSI